MCAYPGYKGLNGHSVFRLSVHPGGYPYVIMRLLRPLALAEHCFSNNLPIGKESVDSQGHNHKDTEFEEWKELFFSPSLFFLFCWWAAFLSQGTYFDDDCVIMKNL